MNDSSINALLNGLLVLLITACFFGIKKIVDRFGGRSSGPKNECQRSWSSVYTLAACNAMISEGKCPADPFTILNDLNKKGVRPDNLTYRNMLLLCLSENNYTAANKLQEVILDPLGPVIPSAAIAVLLVRVAHFKLIERNTENRSLNVSSQFDDEIEEIRAKLPSLSLKSQPIITNEIIKSYLEQGRSQKAISDFERFISTEEIDQESILLYLKALETVKFHHHNQKNKITAIKAISDSSSPIYPEIISKMIEILVKAKNVDEAVELFTANESLPLTERSLIAILRSQQGLTCRSTADKAISKLVPVNKNIILALLQYHSSCDQLDLCTALIEQYSEEIIEDEALIAAISVFISLSDYEKACFYFNKYKNVTNTISTSICLKMITVYNKTEQFPEMVYLYERMKSSSSSYIDLSNYHAILLAFINAKYEEGIIEIYAILSEQHNETLAETVLIQIMDVMAASDYFEFIDKLIYDRIAIRNLKTYNLICHYISLTARNKKRVTKLYELFNLLVRHQYALCNNAYETVITTLSEQFFDRGLAVFNYYTASENSICPRIYFGMVNACFKQNKLREGGETLLRVVEKRIDIGLDLFKKMLLKIKKNSDKSLKPKESKAIIDKISKEMKRTDYPMKKALGSFFNRSPSRTVRKEKRPPKRVSSNAIVKSIYD